MNAPAVLTKLSQRFHTLRRRHMAVRIGIVAALTTMALLSAWIVLACCDFAWELPLETRRIAVAGILAAVSVGLLWRLVRVIHETRQKSFAALLETSFEEFGQRIRTVLDTVDGRVDGPAVMLAALGHQTLGRWETTAPNRILPLWKLLVAVVLGIVAIATTLLMFNAGDQWQTAMLRATGRDLPYTTFSVTPGNDHVLEGTPLEVSLRLRGRTNRDVALRYCQIPFESAGENAEKEAPGEWIELGLSPTEDDPGLFTSQLGKASRPIEYQFVTSVGPTARYRIALRPQITARQTIMTIEPPAYTKLETRSIYGTDATALEQSRVQVSIETNHPLEKTELEIDGAPVDATMVTSAADDGRQWTFALPCRKTLTWRFTGSDSDGTPMKAVSGKLRVQIDQPPTLTWRDPSQELRVHTLAEVPMRLLVSDDYGVSEAAIVFQLGGEEEFVLANWTAEDREEDSPPTTRLTLEEILPLETLRLTERDYISYYAYAIDNRQPEPGRAESDVRYIDIRPLRQYFREVEQPPGQVGGTSLVVPLDEIIRRQRFLINRTRRLTKSTGDELAGQLRTIDRLVENQSELAGLTRLLTEFLLSQGNDDVEALNQAEAAMLQASDSLSAANFDLALVQQEDALRALAEARRTVEMLLSKNMSAKQRMETQRFTTQFNQKLRRDRPKTEQEQIESLKKIAQRQRQLGQRARSLAMAAATSPGGSAQTMKTDQKSPPSQKGVPSKEANSDTSPEGASREEQLQQLYAEQIELLERVKVIEEETADRLASSKLLADRMRQSQADMNGLAGQARDSDLETFPEKAQEASEQLQEMGVQLEALAPIEAVNRVASLREMITSMANMENALSQQLQDKPRDSENASTDPKKPSQSLARMARQLRSRSETIKDTISAPVELGDSEMGEIQEQLQRLSEDNELEPLLASSKEATGKWDESKDSPQSGAGKHEEAKQAYGRAAKYAESALRLDQLFRKLVQPRMARLRQLEQQATNLAQQMQGENRKGEGGQSEEEREDQGDDQNEELSAETKAGLAQLEGELRDAGLPDLAEMLEQVADASPTQPGSRDLPANEFSPETNQKSGSIVLVARELQERIQEMILQDIISDRDTPVPPEYRRAVDNYLRVLAGEAEAVEAGAHP
ncbi:hypothetical protein GC197_00180 [bacterium]|nr:hypothetical protein [bacterium]